MGKIELDRERSSAKRTAKRGGNNASVRRGWAGGACLVPGLCRFFNAKQLQQVGEREARLEEGWNLFFFFVRYGMYGVTVTAWKQAQIFLQQ